MRGFAESSIAVFLVAAAALPGAALAPAAAAGASPSQARESAETVLAGARKALGGDANQAAVKTILATGRTRRVSGANLIPVEFEIAVELPAKYVRKDEIPAQESGPSSNGFNADRLIQMPPPVQPAGRVGGPSPMAQQPQDAQHRARVTALKQDFARLTLGMFAMSFDSYPLTFTHAGQAEAPQGRADVIDVKGPGNFAARFFVMSDTHLPVMLSWTTPVTPANVVITAPGQGKPPNLPPGAVVVEGPAPPADGASKGDQDAYASEVAALREKTMTGAKPTENRVYYSDYRDTDGLRFPFRLRRAIGSDTVEETTFDRFQINVRIDSRKFEPVK